MTIETSLVEVVGETGGEGNGNGNLSGSASIAVIPVITFLVRYEDTTTVDVDVPPFTKPAGVNLDQETCAKCPSGITVHEIETGAGVRNPTPYTGLLVAIKRCGGIPQEIEGEVVLESVEALLGETPVTYSGTHGGGEPFTSIEIYGKAGHNDYVDRTGVTGVETGVSTQAKTNEGVVPDSVSLIRATDNVTVCITVSVLLCVGAY